MTGTSSEQTVITNLTSNQQNVLVDSGWITATGIPNVLVVPNGIWHLYAYFTKSTSTANVNAYFTISKWNGSTASLLFTSDPVLIGWDTNNTTPVEIKLNAVATTVALSLTDRLILNLYLNQIHHKWHHHGIVINNPNHQNSNYKFYT